MRQVLFASTCEEGTGIAPAVALLLLFCISWVMNETAYKYLSPFCHIPTFCTRFWGCSLLYEGGAQAIPEGCGNHCAQGLGQPPGATLLKMPAKAFRGAEGCSLLVRLASKTKFYVNKQHVQRSICSGFESWLLLMDPGLDHGFGVPGGAGLRCVTQV